MIFVTAAFVLILTGSQRQNDARETVGRIDGAVAEANALQTKLVDLQTGVRGYAITGNPRFLRPYTDALVAIPQVERRLSAKAGDGSRPLLDGIYGAIDSYADDYLAGQVRQVDRGELEAAAAVIKKARGKRRVDAIRGNFDRLFANLEDESRADREAADKTAARATAISIGALVLTPFLIGLIVFLVARWIVRPVERVSVAAKKLAGGDLSARAEADGPAEIGELAGSFNKMADELQRNRAELEERNEELEAFSYSVSHDLRAPLRAVDGFSQALIEDCGEQIGDEGRGHLRRIRGAAARMSEQIDDLLRLSRVSRSEVRRESVDFSSLTREVVEELAERDPDREVQVRVEDGLRVEADRRLLRIALENLVGNAWKFTAGGETARIEVSAESNGEGRVFLVRDNGAGFDMAYVNKLFGVFQRLHSVSEFEGTGVGLATVQRVVTKHGGRVWAEAEVGRGATFHFTLGDQSMEAPNGKQQRSDPAGRGQPGR